MDTEYSRNEEGLRIKGGSTVNLAYFNIAWFVWICAFNWRRL